MEKIYARLIPFIAIIPVVLFTSCSGTRPQFVNQGHDKLAVCPNTPNCVLTTGADSSHAIEPLHYSGSIAEASTKLIAVIDSMPRTKIITKTDDYVYAEFTSKVWRFVDDVEFSFNDSTKTIHFRSASRLGKSDMGVNRKRMEEIRRRFNR